MNQVSDILLVTSDLDTESAIKLMLESDNCINTVRVCPNLAALEDRLEHGVVPVVLIDIDSDPDRLLGELELVTNSYPHTRFIVMATQTDSAIVMSAMQAGARHVQSKDKMSTELPEVLHRMISNAPRQTKPSGSVITVLSAGGGAGCTTLVVNLANELQLTTAEPVLIADLDYAYGAVASYLEIDGQYGIADVLAHSSKIDAELIQTTAVNHSDSIRVLQSPASIGSSFEALKSDRLAEVIMACKQEHRFTLFDAPRVTIDVASTLAHASEVTLVVFQPLVKDIRVTRNLIAELESHGVPRKRIKPIMNRYRKRREMISFDEVKKALGGMAPECLSNDYASASRGINYGKLLSSSAPRSALRKDMVHLASQFSDLEAIGNGNGYANGSGNDHSVAAGNGNGSGHEH